jgi:hypothetical protein
VQPGCAGETQVAPFPGGSFGTFEHELRDQLARMFVDGGFDPARDIAGIT